MSLSATRAAADRARLLRHELHELLEDGAVALGHGRAVLLDVGSCEALDQSYIVRTDGVLNEKAKAGPACGWPTRENRSRNSAAMSVYVPTLEREPPTRF
jgi:hypothetical protein